MAEEQIVEPVTLERRDGVSYNFSFRQKESGNVDLLASRERKGKQKVTLYFLDVTPDECRDLASNLWEVANILAAAKARGA